MRKMRKILFLKCDKAAMDPYHPQVGGGHRAAGAIGRHCPENVIHSHLYFVETPTLVLQVAGKQLCQGARLQGGTGEASVGSGGKREAGDGEDWGGGGLEAGERGEGEQGA